MFAFVERITFKIKLAVLILALIIFSLVSFGIYVKVSQLISYTSVKSQAESTVNISEDLDILNENLETINASILNLTKEKCIHNAILLRKSTQECEELY